ncbi:recombinase family protein [Sphingomonas floccifaciens]|uniref:Recombinase family protein n=1 Tax=Sphingomonas floccifaciens TaxID=1844115 RepID=A0ABW4N8P8_9SPHN
MSKTVDSDTHAYAVSKLGLDGISLQRHYRATDSIQRADQMSRIFAYCRVSTTDQTTDNQVREIETAGFAIDPKRIVVETVSGSVAAIERNGFARLLNRLEASDVLIVTKLDRLGRNAMDVRGTVERLAAEGVRVHCLALGGVDLTSAAGKMTMGVIAAVAEFERDLLIERTQAGLQRAKAEGKRLGRPQTLTGDQQQAIVAARKEGVSLGVLAKRHGVSRAAIQRVERRAVA